MKVKHGRVELLAMGIAHLYTSAMLGIGSNPVYSSNV